MDLTNYFYTRYMKTKRYFKIVLLDYHGEDFVLFKEENGLNGEQVRVGVIYTPLPDGEVINHVIESIKEGTYTGLVEWPISRLMIELDLFFEEGEEPEGEESEERVWTWKGHTHEETYDLFKSYHW